MLRGGFIACLIGVAGCGGSEAPQHAWSTAELVAVVDGVGQAPPRVSGGGQRALLSWWDQHPESPMGVAWYRDKSWRIERPLRWFNPPLSFNGLVLADDDRAVVTWDGFSRAQATSYTATSGWGEPVQAPRVRYGVQWYRYAADDNARGLAVWLEASNVLVAWFDGVSWSEPTTIGSGTRPDVAVSRDGRSALVAWSDAGTMTASQFTEGTWLTATRISANGSGAGNPVIRTAVDNDANATVIWTQGFGDAGVHANHYSPGAGWAGAELVIASRSAARVALDAAASTATMVMAQSDGELWQSRLRAGSGWSAPIRIAVETSQAAHVVVDAHGDAVIGWATFAPNWGVWTTSCSDHGCSEPSQLDRGHVDWLTAPVLSISSDGSVVAAWWRDNADTTSVWASHGDLQTRIE